MLRYFQQVDRIVLTTLALLCGLCMSDDPVACTQLANMTCQAVQDTSVEYSLNVSSTTYHESQLLSITISRNRCPNFEEYGGFTEDTPKKSWNYTITAISSSNQAPIGYFKVPSGSRLEIDSCNHSTVLLFSTCEASPVDLPRTYDWVAPPTTAGTICFKAVIQPPTGSCETIERCIAPLTSYTERPVDLEISGDGELGSGVAVESTVAAECNKKWNCSFQSNNRSKPLCGSDGVLYPNNCYRKHAECLKRTIIITKPARGPCRSQPTAQPTATLHNYQTSTTNLDQTCQGMNQKLRQYERPNRSLCTCVNQYKPIQCEQNIRTRQVQCWCAGSSGAITSPNKYTMDCGLLQAELKCV